MHAARPFVLASVVVFSSWISNAAGHKCETDFPSQHEAAKNLGWFKGEYEQCFVPDGSAAKSQARNVAACNWFVPTVLEKQFTVKGLRTSTGERFLTTAELETRVPSDAHWKVLGAANDQTALTKAHGAALAGSAVIALGVGHVAIVIPGDVSRSDGWGLLVPNAASWRINDAGSIFYGCPLSFAWKKADTASVKLYQYSP
jgi:hypothetical protein